MRLTPRLPARVVWEEGMYLAPHHFQAQRRQAEDALALVVHALFPFPYGLARIVIDHDALRAGTIALRHARGLLPDGTPFHAPDADPLPAPIAVADRFLPTQDAHVVHLALPAWRDDGGNVEGADAADDALDGIVPRAPRASDGAAPAHAGPRYVAARRTVVDEVSGSDAVEVRFAAKRLRLALDVELGADEVSLPVARVRRDGAGHLVFDPDFVPPCLQLGASPRLVSLLHELVEMLDAKGVALSTAMLRTAPAGGGGAPSSYAGNEIATRWLLHTIRSAEAPLRHLLQTRRAHPERLWLELARLAGALCTFSLTTAPRDLPAYDHDDLTGCFAAIERHVRAHLDLVVTPRALVIPLVPTSDVLHVGTVPDPRCFDPRARWYLSVRSSIGPAETAVRVPALVKACRSQFIVKLVQRAFPGLPLAHVPAPPPSIAPRADRAYFEITTVGPCMEGLAESREFGAYVPDRIPDASLELIVLAPG